MTFEEKVYADEFCNPLPYGKDPKVRKAYDVKESELYDAFMADLRKWLAENGVPDQYISKVVSKAWEDGHASGYSEILNCARGLAEIFEVQS